MGWEEGQAAAQEQRRVARIRLQHRRVERAGGGHMRRHGGDRDGWWVA